MVFGTKIPTRRAESAGLRGVPKWIRCENRRGGHWTFSMGANKQSLGRGASRLMLNGPPACRLRADCRKHGGSPPAEWSAGAGAGHQADAARQADKMIHYLSATGRKWSRSPRRSAPRPPASVPPGPAVIPQGQQVARHHAPGSPVTTTAGDPSTSRTSCHSPLSKRRCPQLVQRIGRCEHRVLRKERRAHDTASANAT